MFSTFYLVCAHKGPWKCGCEIFWIQEDTCTKCQKIRPQVTDYGEPIRSLWFPLDWSCVFPKFNAFEFEQGSRQNGKWQCLRCVQWNSVQHHACKNCYHGWKPSFSYCTICAICFDMFTCPGCASNSSISPATIYKTYSLPHDYTFVNDQCKFMTPLTEEKYPLKCLVEPKKEIPKSDIRYWLEPPSLIKKKTEKDSLKSCSQCVENENQCSACLESLHENRLNSTNPPCIRACDECHWLYDWSIDPTCPECGFLYNISPDRSVSTLTKNPKRDNPSSWGSALELPSSRTKKQTEKENDSSSRVVDSRQKDYSQTPCIRACSSCRWVYDWSTDPTCPECGFNFVLGRKEHDSPLNKTWHELTHSLQPKKQKKDENHCSHCSLPLPHSNDSLCQVHLNSNSWIQCPACYSVYDCSAATSCPECGSSLGQRIQVCTMCHAAPVSGGMEHCRQCYQLISTETPVFISQACEMCQAPVSYGRKHCQKCYQLIFTATSPVQLPLPQVCEICLYGRVRDGKPICERCLSSHEEKKQPKTNVIYQEKYALPLTSYLCANCSWFNMANRMILKNEGLGRKRIRCGLCQMERQGYWSCPHCTFEHKLDLVAQVVTEDGRSQECHPAAQKNLLCSMCSRTPCSRDPLRIHFRDGLQLTTEEDETWHLMFHGMLNEKNLEKQAQAKNRVLAMQIEEYEKKYDEFHFMKKDQETIEIIRNSFQILVERKDVVVLQELQQLLASEPNFLKCQIRDLVAKERKSLCKKNRFFLDQFGMWLMLHGVTVPECWLPISPQLTACPKLIPYVLFVMDFTQHAPVAHIVCEFLTEIPERTSRIFFRWLRRFQKFIAKHKLEERV